MKLTKIAAIFALLLVNSINAYAFELVIEDSLGNVRHVSEVSGKANVKMSVSDSAGNAVDGTVITITLKDGYAASEIPQEDKIKQAKAEAGIAMFKDVNPGRWTMTAGSDSLVLAEIDVLDPASMRASAEVDFDPGNSLFGLTQGELMGGALVVGGLGGSIYAYRENDDSNNNDSEPSPFQ